MDDVFLEKIVTKRKTGQDYAKIAGILLLAFVLLTAIFMYGSMFSFLIPFLLVGIGYGLWYLLTGMNKEYEYIVTNGDLDIDIIIAKRRRKRVLSVKAKEFELMAKTGTDDDKQARKGNYKLLDFSGYAQSADNWFILTNYNQERVMILFAPDERMLKNMKRYNPSRIKYNQFGQ